MPKYEYSFGDRQSEHIAKGGVRMCAGVSNPVMVSTLAFRCPFASKRPGPLPRENKNKQTFQP